MIAGVAAVDVALAAAEAGCRHEQALLILEGRPSHMETNVGSAGAVVTVRVYVEQNGPTNSGC